MSSAPIDIVRASSSSPSFDESPRRGLYVPVHRRNATPSTSPSSRSSSPDRASFASSSRSASPWPITSASTHSSGLPIYSTSDLLLLSASPLSRLAPEAREELREHAPEVVLNRKQRKSQAWHRNQAEMKPTSRASWRTPTIAI